MHMLEHTLLCSEIWHVHRATKKIQWAFVRGHERVHLIEEQNSLLVKALGGADTRLVESEQTVLLKENCIKALMVEKEKCNKELLFEKKMTAVAQSM